MGAEKKVAADMTLWKTLKAVSIVGLPAIGLGFSGQLYAARYTAIVQGLSGDPYYQRHFDNQSEQLAAATQNLPGVQLKLFQGDGANKSALLAWLQQLQTQLGAADQLVIYYIGHGSDDGQHYKFNLSGPDLTGEELKAVLEQSGAGYLLLVNTSSASGALLESFADSKVNLITATRSGAERNATRFGRFLAEGLSSTAADLDKNQSISAQELFAFAERETQAYYQQQGLLATEHAQQQGKAMDRLELARLSVNTAQDDPQLQQLFTERDELDQRIDALRLARIGMTDNDYLEAYQQLMLELAQLQTRIDQRQEALQ